ncbi:MAG: hypothetical protein KBC73_04390 [Burkholderiaceae bacterium]|nr:hypothetical protein [Burkholderiaceae bacterium]
MNTLPGWLLPFLGTAVVGLGAASAWMTAAATPAATAAAGPASPGPTPPADGRGRSGRAWRWGLTLGLPLAVLSLYVALGHPRALDPAQRARPADAQTMVDKLAARLAAGEGSAQDWAMLARSYRVLDREADAAAAYERAESLALADADLLADWVEARLLSGGRQFDARSLQLLQQGLALAPQHPGLLLLDGLAALQQGQRARAVTRFATLRELQPEGSPDRQAMDSALAELAAGRDPRRLGQAQTKPQEPAARP